MYNKVRQKPAFKMITASPSTVKASYVLQGMYTEALKALWCQLMHSIKQCCRNDEKMDETKHPCS